jgi:CCR4-NOT transcription complex subunit 2
MSTLKNNNVIQKDPSKTQMQNVSVRREVQSKVDEQDDSNFETYNFYKHTPNPEFSQNNGQQLRDAKQMNNLQQSMAKMSLKPIPTDTTLAPTFKKEKEVLKKSDKFGLLGLLGVIKMEDKDSNLLALGLDLTTLGLNLNSPELNLYTTFASPWNEPPTRIQPEFTIPNCYRLQTQLPLNKNWNKYQDETLFYMFYSMPKDVCQVLAAKELTRRKWIFHVTTKIWLQRIPGVDPVKQDRFEKGTYLYFDCTTWKKQKKENFVLEYDKIMY